jgi:hypothetical protein
VGGSERYAEENILTQEGGTDRRLEKLECCSGDFDKQDHKPNEI